MCEKTRCIFTFKSTYFGLLTKGGKSQLLKLYILTTFRKRAIHNKFFILFFIHRNSQIGNDDSIRVSMDKINSVFVIFLHINS